MKKTKILWLSIFCLSIIFTLILSGCEEEPKDNEFTTTKIYIENSKNDGYIAREESLVEGIIILESSEPMKVGLFSSSEDSPNEQNYISRGILRFDISDWDNTDITFYIKCTNVIGNPNPLEVYFIDDPGVLVDFSSIWPLTDSSIKFFGDAFPSDNEWIEISVPQGFVDTIVKEKYSRNEYMTIMLKLYIDDTLNEYGNYYEFATVDYSPNDDSDQPYIKFG